jgi:hypothetical protein
MDGFWNCYSIIFELEQRMTNDENRPARKAAHGFERVHLTTVG